MELYHKDKDGVTLLDHLGQVIEASGVVDQRLEEMHDDLGPWEHIWVDFLSLHRGRGGGGMGPSPLGYSDILYWQELTGISLPWWEVDMILMMDMAYLEAVADKLRK